MGVCARSPQWTISATTSSLRLELWVQVSGLQPTIPPALLKVLVGYHSGWLLHLRRWHELLQLFEPVDHDGDDRWLLRRRLEPQEALTVEGNVVA